MRRATRDPRAIRFRIAGETYEGRPDRIVRALWVRSLVSEAETLSEYLEEVRDWTNRLTGRRVRPVRTCRELLGELDRLEVGRILPEE